MFRRIHALVIKEIKQLSRDTKTLAVLLFFPMFLLIMFGYAISFDVHNLTTAVFDQDLSPESREFLNFIQAYRYFDVTQSLSSVDEIDYHINREHIQVAIVIPPDFSEKLRQGKTADLLVVLDGVNGNSGQTASGYLNQMVQDYNQDLQLKTAARYGLDFKPIVDIEERIWYNPELKSTNFLVPGLIAFIMMITAVISTALSVVREKEHNTIEQIIVSPVHSVEMMLGKTIPFMFLALLSGTMILVAGWLIFGIAIKGSLLTLFLASLIFLFGALGQGLLISAVANSQAVAFMMAILSSLIPTLLLSGFVFRISSMPLPLQIVSYIVPARYYLVILRGVILKGTSMEIYGMQFFYLILFAAFMLLISSKKMARQM